MTESAPMFREDDLPSVSARDRHGLSHQGVQQSFRARTIAFRAMSPRLRLVTGVAVAQLLVAAVFLSLRGAHLPLTVAVNVASHQVGVIAVPTVVLWVAVGFVSLAW